MVGLEGTLKITSSSKPLPWDLCGILSNELSQQTDRSRVSLLLLPILKIKTELWKGSLARIEWLGCWGELEGEFPKCGSELWCCWCSAAVTVAQVLWAGVDTCKAWKQQKMVLSWCLRLNVADWRVSYYHKSLLLIWFFPKTILMGKDALHNYSLNHCGQLIWYLIQSVILSKVRFSQTSWNPRCLF